MKLLEHFALEIYRVAEQVDKLLQEGDREGAGSTLQCFAEDIQQGDLSILLEEDY